MTFNRKAYQQQYYQERKEEWSDRTKAKRRLYSRISEEIKRLSPCMDCDVSYPPYVMDFDHRPGVDKKFNISDYRNVSSVKALLDEIEKCDLVCANCHRIRTFTRDHRLLV